MSEKAIVFDRVSKSYPRYHQIMGIKNFLFHLPTAIRSLKNARYEVLNGISFEVYRGESFGIIGRNGVGKSTTLGLIAGVLRPDSGRVIVNGRISPLLELGGGFHPELTGRENIILNGVLLGMTRAEVLKRMDEIIEFSELGEFIDQPLRTYSSGMYARLGFSVIAHLDPEILLIDEVLAVGDIGFQKKCLDKMLGFKRMGVTIVFVSHSMGDIEKICDRVMWLEDKRVREVNESKKVITDYINR
jgi:lipopolysaccharide transport system ATP-binding protein